MYVLEHGNVRMECPDNPQRTLAKFGPGSYFGYKQAVRCPSPPPSLSLTSSVACAAVSYTLVQHQRKHHRLYYDQLLVT